ncbi:MAG: hypothetical protein IKI58_10310 [Oscillospiraceae bacterium]|nr:hypothetical protein [Oscillospiraceae bacterium]
MFNHKFSNANQPNETDQLMLAVMREKLEAELEKPASELDTEKISQLTAAIENLSGTERITAEKSGQGIQMIQTEMKRQKRSRTIRRTKWAAACACFLFVISNIWSYSAYGTNAFNAAYQMTTGSVTVDFAAAETAEIPEAEHTEFPAVNNPYAEDMRKICAEHGFDADTQIPAYLPEGFVPAKEYGEYYENENDKTLFFYFRRGDELLDLQLKQFAAPDKVIPVGIPSDYHHIAPVRFGNTVVHIQTEDGLYWGLFQKNLTHYLFVTRDLDYEESRFVLNSFFSEQE